ncbi:MAG: hypothetical protein HDT33_01570 [Clostridiales bacterium]|nr:hypothetical protein [Clostridiales bacterium]
MKKDYMTRLERAARWRLPPQEAEDVIADYRDIVSDPPRTEEELRRDLGNPGDAVMQLTTVKQYRIWLVVFIALAACLLSAALAPLPISPTFRLFRWYEWGGEYQWGAPEFTILTVLPILQLTAGVVLCLVWFLRRREQTKRPLSKGMIFCALLMLAAIALGWWAAWRISSDPDQFLTTWVEDTNFIGEGIGAAYSGKSSSAAMAMNRWLEYGGCTLAGLVGTVALVKARTRDRRWAAVYLLALTSAVLALDVLGMLWNFSSFNILRETIPEDWFQPYLTRYTILTAVGLAGAGVALC